MAIPRPRRVTYGVLPQGPGRRRALLGAGVAAGAALAGISWWSSRPDSSAPAAIGGGGDDDIRQAAALAGVPPADIRPSTGGIHVVYHASTALPSPARPRADGKTTLVWFGAPW
jgi:hypothetical protein